MQACAQIKTIFNRFLGMSLRIASEEQGNVGVVTRLTEQPEELDELWWGWPLVCRELV